MFFGRQSKRTCYRGAGARAVLVDALLDLNHAGNPKRGAQHHCQHYEAPRNAVATRAEAPVAAFAAIFSHNAAADGCVC